MAERHNIYDIEQDDKDAPVTQEQFDFLVESIGKISERIDELALQSGNGANLANANFGLIYGDLW
jgi:hypothetical protein